MRCSREFPGDLEAGREDDVVRACGLRCRERPQGCHGRDRVKGSEEYSEIWGVRG
jgi:hypothetical protein